MKTFYFHPTVVSKRKRNRLVTQRATVAAVQETDEKGNTEFRFGVSVCSVKDSFVKRNGRALAIGRALNPTDDTSFTLSFINDGQTAITYTKLFLNGAMDLLASLGYTVVPKKSKQQEDATTLTV